MTNSPFKLLDSYGPGDKDIFFGRDSEIYALYNLLQQTQLTLVYGASGTGKTSLINAGLPKVFKMADWFKISVRRRDNINESLRTALGSYLPTRPDAEKLPDAVRQIFEARWIPVFLVFDQFEELFTLCQDESERQLFFESLKKILRENTAVKIILTMREEYIGHLYDYEHILPELFDHRFRVEAIKDDTAAGVISRTCRVHRIPLENGDNTAHTILQRLKVGKRAVHLPYLQIYLHALYGKAKEINDAAPRFTEALIQDPDFTLNKVLNRFIGGKIDEAQAFLKGQYPDLPGNFAEAVLDHFATDNGTKRALRVQELATLIKQPAGHIEAALRYFDGNAKLLRADEDEVERYEPVHDVVALQIYERRSVEDKEYKAFLQQLETAHQRWVRDNNATDRLLPEIDLNRVEIYRERLEQREEFREKWAVLVEKSHTHIEAVRRRRLLGNIALAGITVVAVVAMVAALFSRAQVEKEREEALDLKKEAEKARDHISKMNDSLSKINNSLTETQRNKRIAEYNTFKTEADAARKDNRYAEARDACQKALELADGPRELAIIRTLLTTIKKEKNDYEFKRYKDLGLAMKAAGDYPAAMEYLNLAFQINKNDKVVNAAINEYKK